MGRLYDSHPVEVPIKPRELVNYNDIPSTESKENVPLVTHFAISFADLHLLNKYIYYHLGGPLLGLP